MGIINLHVLSTIKLQVDVFVHSDSSMACFVVLSIRPRASDMLGNFQISQNISELQLVESMVSSNFSSRARDQKRYGLFKSTIFIFCPFNILFVHCTNNLKIPFGTLKIYSQKLFYVRGTMCPPSVLSSSHLYVLSFKKMYCHVSQNFQNIKQSMFFNVADILPKTSASLDFTPSVFETRFSYKAQGSLELAILLFQPPQCWVDRQTW